MPNDWSKQGGFFSKVPAPWGSLEDARRLIAFGKINEGRELFRKLLDAQKKGPGYNKCLAAYCSEMLRPPRVPTGLDRAGDLPTTEKNALSAILDFMALDASRGPKAMLAATEGYPSTDSGAVLLLTAYLGWSDCYLQTQILQPLGRAMEFMVTIVPVHGIASLLLRQHQVAWKSFVKGVVSPDLTLQTYEKELSLKIEKSTRRYLVNVVQICCWIGEGLVLRDLCFDAEAQTHFSALADAVDRDGKELTDVLRSCCALLGR